MCFDERPKGHCAVHHRVREAVISSRDGHDGREIVFASNRGGTTAFGGQDIWSSTRKSVNGSWSAPVNWAHDVSANTVPARRAPSYARTMRNATRRAMERLPAASVATIVSR